MAVLVEGISVIVRADRIKESVRGGLDVFKLSVPNQTFCGDNEIVRIGFMTPADAKAYVGELEGWGLKYLEDGRAIDLVVAD